LVGPSNSYIFTANGYNSGVATHEEPKIRGNDSTVELGPYGLYAPVSQKKKKGDNELDRRTFRQKYSSLSKKDATTTTSLHSSGWPSLTQTASMISAPSSALAKYKQVPQNNQHEIIFVEINNKQMWCLQSNQNKWCSPSLNHPIETIHQYPPSGIWASSTNANPISLSCPTPSTTQPIKKNKHHKQQNAKQNQNVKFLLHHPTTTLLLLLNIGLAYQYWNHRVSPSAVCKSYNKICVQHEWWRGFTGATAHFEPLHIGFNMVSLNTLGKDLEGGFGSVVFLVYNIALVVMCTIVMMGMVYGRLAWVRYQSSGIGEGVLQEKEKRLKETSTVGYSGVLFAWMVVSTLERNQPTCPIPFFSDVCFSTQQVPGLPWLKFNIAPIVSLFVAQFIMPRVSFIGHLAGIACGFGLHWGWGFPPLEVCSPNVLIGGVYLVGCLIASRRLIPVRPLLNEATISGDNSGLHLESGEGLGGEVNDNGLCEESNRAEVLRKQRTLITIRNLIGIVAVGSMFVFDVTSSLVFSQFILLAYFVAATQASLIVWTYTHINKVESDVIQPEKDRCGVLWRGYIVAVSISIVVDCMSVASWAALYTFVLAERSPRVALVPACLFMIVRVAANILGLVVSFKVLNDFGQVGSGIFVQVFSFVLNSSKKIGNGLFISHMPWTAFEGRGTRLGTRART
jgi:membrane associated rhomboid family serine protease